MAGSTHGVPKLAYPTTWATLGLALAFPVALMVFNPTLMFERGWEQYVGTTIYVAALVAIGRELLRLRADERAFAQATGWLDAISNGEPGPDEADRRVLPTRIRQLAAHACRGRSASPERLMELNREGSGLDQEEAAGRFTLPRYILYLLPVIGFIGTVEGISKALMNISRVLPMVKDLDGFMGNLTSVTSALQIAFDSTLLALFLSAALMLAITLVHRRGEDMLARVDRWVVERLLTRLGRDEATPQGSSAEVAALLGPHLDRIEGALVALGDRLGDGLGPHVERFAESVDRLPGSLEGFRRGADSIARIGDDLQAIGQAGDSVRKGAASLSRIEAKLAERDASDGELEAIRRGLDRACGSIDDLAQSWAQAYERSSRSTQEQLARTLNSLKDALELLQVSMEQGNSLYRNIVKKMFDRDRDGNDQIRAA